MKDRKGKKETQLRHALRVYALVMAGLLLWNLLHCRDTEWITRDLPFESTVGAASRADLTDSDSEDADSDQGESGSDQDAWELRDDAPYTVRIQEGERKKEEEKARLRGAALLGYENAKGLVYRDETIFAEISRGEDGETAAASMLLKNQTPYYKDETMLYIAFPKGVGIAPGDACEIRFSTEGLIRNGIYFSGEETGAEGGLRAGVRLFYALERWNLLRALLIFLLEAAAGFFFLFAAVRIGRAYGLFSSLHRAGEDGPGSDRNTVARFFSAGRGRRDGRSGQEPSKEEDTLEEAGQKAGGRGAFHRPGLRKLLPCAAVILGCCLIMCYTWKEAVGETSRKAGAQYLVSGSLEKERLKLHSGDVLTQKVRPRRDMLSAVGIRVKTREGEKFPDWANLTWELSDENGGCLFSASARAADLEKADSVLSKQTADKEIRKAAASCLLLPLDGRVEKSAGKIFYLKISVDGGAEGDSDEIFPIQVSRGGNLRAAVNGEFQDFEISALGIYEDNGILAAMFFRICLFLLLILCVLYAAAGALKDRTWAMYFLCAVTLGMAFSFVTPAYTVPDERAHIDTAYDLSNRFLGIRDQAGPSRLLKRACDVDMYLYNYEEITLERYRAEAGLFGPVRSEEGRELTPVYARNALSNASLLCYLPAAAGLTAGRLLGQNMFTMVMMGRWMNLLACAALVALAIRRMPFGGASLAVIGLLPRTLYLMASCSYDGMIFAGAAVFTAWLAALLWGEEFTPADLAVFLFSAGHLVLVKGGVYLPLLGLCLLIPCAGPAPGRGNKRGRDFYGPASLLAGAALLFAIKNLSVVLQMLSAGSGSSTLFSGTRTLYTMSDFTRNPLRLLHLLVNTVYKSGDDLLLSMAGRNLAQKNWIIFSFFLLMLLGMIKKSGEKVHFSWSARFLTLGTAAASALLIALSMLLAYTPVGSEYIQGIQGRYFLPFLPALLLATENSIVQSDRIRGNALLFAAAALNAVTLCEILLNCFAVI